MSLAIRFQVLPDDLEARVKLALQALREGKITDIQATSFFFQILFPTLRPDV